MLQITQLLPLQKKFTDLNNQLKLKEYELELFKGRAEQNEHHKVVLLPFVVFCELYFIGHL